MQQVDGTPLGCCDVDAVEEATDPGSEDEEGDQDEQRSTDRVHDSLEVTLILGTLDKRRSLSDELGYVSPGQIQRILSNIQIQEQTQ